MKKFSKYFYLLCALLFFDAVSALGQPTVSNIPASDVTSNSAVLNGTVTTPNNDTGDGCNTYFQYSTSNTGWTYTNPAATPGTPTVIDRNQTNLVCSTSVSSLTSNTLYYFRLYIYQSAGSFYNAGSPLVSFWTLCSVPDAASATNILSTSFQANWSITGTAATGYQLDVARDAGFTDFVSGYNNLPVGSGTSYTVTGLSGATTFYYRVRAVNGVGAETANSNITTVVIPDPTVNVTAPNGNETYIVGSTISITWNSTGISAESNMTIEYSTAGIAGTWNSITTSAPNNGTYAWIVPNTPSADCFVKVSYGSHNDVSDTHFTITAPTITITSPNTALSFDVASTQTITWTSSNVENVKIEYSTNNGGAYTTLTESTPNTGSYSWIIPDVPSTQCLIKVTDVLSGINDLSDVQFTINTPTFTAIHPNSGTYYVGTIQNITWTPAGLDSSAHVTIALSRNGVSGPWTNISTAADNSGNYSWTITGPNSPNCRLRIIYGIDTVTASGNFAISAPSINVATPGTLPYKSNQTITWTTGGIAAGTLMKIEYTTDGTNYITLADNITNGTNGGSYQWNPVTRSPSTTCRIRMSVTSTPSMNDESDMFTISGIRVIAPNGGELPFMIGTTQTIRWVSVGLSSCNNVRIELSTDGGVTFSNNSISPSTNNNGLYDWLITSGYAPTTQGMIRVACVNESNSDTSDGDFTIGINLASPPNQSECNLTVGLEFDWDGDPARYNLQVATDAGFNNIVFQEDPGSGNTMASSYTTNSSDNLQNGTTYYWRIRIWSGGAWVTQTPVWSFSTVNLLSGTVANIYVDDITYDNLDVHWDLLSGASGYEIVVQRFATGNWVDYNTQIVGNVNTVNFAITYWPLSLYRVQIRAFSSCAWGSYSGWPEFNRIGYGVSAISPDDKASCISTTADLTLSWDAWGSGFSDNNFWRVDYRKKGETAWRNILLNSLSQHAPNCTLSSSLLESNTVYEWIVSIPMYSFNTDAPLVIFQFSTGGVTSPTALSATTCTLLPTFSWTSVSGIIYTLEYKPSTVPDWSGAAVIPDLSVGSYAVTSVLPYNTTYNWRVTATSSSCGGSTATVNGNNFTTKPDRTVNSSPVNGASIQSTSLTLIWETGPAGATYNLQVATDQNFNNVIINMTGLSTNSQSINVNINQTYYWHVKVITASCSSGSDYTDAYSFTTTSLSVPRLTTNTGSSSFTAWENSGGAISTTQIDYSRYYVLFGDFVKVSEIPINYSSTLSSPVTLTTPANVDFYFLRSSDYGNIANYTSSAYGGTMTISTLPAGDGTTISSIGLEGILHIPLNLIPGDYFLCWIVTDPTTGEKSFSHTSTQHMHLVEYLFYLDGAIPQVPTLKVLPGKPIELPVNINQLTGTNINEFSGTVIYDSSVLRLKDELLKTGSLTQNWDVNISSVEEGRVTFSAKGSDTINKNGILFKLKFDVIGLPGSISPILLTDFKINSMLVIPVNGSVTVTNDITQITDLKIVPVNYMLQQNYPNPFNPTTTITYALVSDAFVTLRVYDALGREIKTLEKGNQKAGYHDVEFNAGNLPSGVYYYVLNLYGKGNSKILTRKMVLIK